MQFPMQDWVVTFLDVGQGDATHILLPDRTSIFIDTGPDVSVGSPVAWWVKGHGHGPIRSIVITHNHIDHFGGLLSAAGDLTVRIDEVYLNGDRAFDDLKAKQSRDFGDLYALLKRRELQGKTKVRRASAGTIIYTDGNLELRVLYPNKIKHPCSLDQNITSMVIALFRVGSFSRPIIAWGGDAYLKDVIEALGGHKPELLMGPHHGSPQDTSFAKVCKSMVPTACPGCVYASLGGKYKSQPKRQYVMSVSARNSTWCCSQVSKQCRLFENGKLRHGDVYKGSALLGIWHPSGVSECRGSMRVLVDSHGVLRFDIHQKRFLMRVKELVPERHCNK